MHEISTIIIIILIYKKLGSVGPAKQKIKLSLPYILRKKNTSKIVFKKRL